MPFYSIPVVAWNELRFCIGKIYIENEENFTHIFNANNTENKSNLFLSTNRNSITFYFYCGWFFSSTFWHVFRKHQKAAFLWIIFSFKNLTRNVKKKNSAVCYSTFHETVALSVKSREKSVWPRGWKETWNCFSRFFLPTFMKLYF